MIVISFLSLYTISTLVADVSDEPANANQIVVRTLLVEQMPKIPMILFNTVTISSR